MEKEKKRRRVVSLFWCRMKKNHLTPISGGLKTVMKADIFSVSIDLNTIYFGSRRGDKFDSIIKALNRKIERLKKKIEKKWLEEMTCR